jgi:hypothetical protein
MKLKRKSVSIDTKIAAIKLLGEGNSVREVAFKLAISIGTVQKAKKKKEDLLMEGESMQYMKMACLNSGTEINTVLWRWFCTACANGYPISGPILQSKALSIAKAFDADHNFKASNGCLEK